MASESSAGFHRHHHHQQRGELFQSGAGGGISSNSSSGSGEFELISMGDYENPEGRVDLGGNDDPGGGIIFSSSVGQNSLKSSCTTTFLVDPVPGLNHDTGLAAEWSIDEQLKLEEGLARCANEPNMLRYIKTAASLRNKTVRDVALRCRWMTRKRRKLEDLSFGKKEMNLTERFKFSLKNRMSSSASSLKVAPYFLTVNHHDLSGVLSGKARYLLEENYQAFDQISANLSNLKLQQNMDLFCRTRNNLTTILNDMRNMPGIMSQMPPLPVLLDLELANSIFPCSSQPMMFSSLSTTTPLKQEPGC